MRTASLPLLHGILLAVCCLAMAAAPAAADRPGYPPVLNMFLSNSLNPGDIELLAQWDVLILDADFEHENPGGLSQIRALNPDITILAYIPINGVDTIAVMRPPQTLVHKYWMACETWDYWLYSVDGTRASDWPGKWTTNLTLNCPENPQGENFGEWFARFIWEEVWDGGATSWDGICLDDVWDDIGWMNNIIASPLDTDRDGIQDEHVQLNTWWAEGNSACVQAMRGYLGPNVTIMGNGGNNLYADLNGAMLENFPYNGPADQGNPYGYSWQGKMFTNEYSYFNGLANYNDHPRRLMTVNTYWSTGDRYAPVKAGRFEAHKRLCLGSTLLGDGYFSFDFSWDDHAALWWEPEYDMEIGDPVGPAYNYTLSGKSIWRRDYTNATVVVNANNSSVGPEAGVPYIAGWDAYIGPRIYDPPPADVTAPGVVPAYWGFAIDSTTVRAKWIASGDDGNSGRADSYAIRYSLTGAPTTDPLWAAATVVPNTIVPNWPGTWDSLDVSGFPPGTTIWFVVRAVDEAGNLAPTGGKSLRVSTLPVDPPGGDITPPSPIGTLTLDDRLSNGATFGFYAPGDDGVIGQCAAYQGRYSSAPITSLNWNAATPFTAGLPVPVQYGNWQTGSVTGLNPLTTYYVTLRGQDNAGNLGPVGNNISFTTLPSGDTTPPSTVTDLAATAVNATTLELSFTAPADNDAIPFYEMRYLAGTTAFHDTMWSLAVSVNAGTPSAPGTLHTVQVPGLITGQTYAFRFRCRDVSNNQSALSNVAVGTPDATEPPPDITGPAKVTDLQAGSITDQSASLGFTAPGDAEGSVAAYSLRYVTGASFPGSAWAGATQVPTPPPAAPGTPVSVPVTGLAAATTYSFALISTDDSGNPSPVSNIVTLTTLPPPDTTGPPAVADLAATATGETTVQVGFTAPADGEGTVAAYELRYVAGTTFTDGMWAGATPAAAPAPGTPGAAQAATVSGLAPGSPYAFRMRSQDDSGNWSALSNTATATTQSATPPPDTSGPLAVSNLAVSGSDPGGLTLGFTAPADAAGSVTAYEVRYRAGTAFPMSQWNAATPVPPPSPQTPGTEVSFHVGGLAAASTYSFRMRSRDDSGNWSDLSNRATGTTPSDPPPPPPADTTGPAAVADLAILDAGEDFLTVGFTAPADAQGTVAAYDLRYVTGASLPSGSWAAATPVAVTTAAPGTPVQVTVPGLNPGTPYAFRVRSQDGPGNWSALSNTATDSTLTPPPPPDTEAPAPVANLAAVVRDAAEGRVRLTWTAVGDDGVQGQAAQYEVRWRLGSLGAATWAEATPVAGVPAPKPAGEAEALILIGLPVPSEVAFALVVLDEAGNASPLSNVASVTIELPPPPDTTPPLPVTGVTGGMDGTAVRLAWEPSPAPDLAIYRIYRARAESPGFTLYRTVAFAQELHDAQVAPGREYAYRVTAVDVAGNESAVSRTVSVRVPHVENVMMPVDFFSADFPSPNPSPGAVSLPMAVGSDTPVSVFVFDVNGRLVRGFEDRLPAGRGAVRWDGQDESGRLVARGVYFLHVRTPLGSEVRRILIAR